MDEDGALLAAGETGEVVIRGRNVTPGYEDNPEANRSALRADGWFRTGDQGDAGRRRAICASPGGSRRSSTAAARRSRPLEVDEVLMDHPAVAQVVTFAMPHDKLGEEVAAAVVLREGMAAAEREIRDFAATRLADFKVPRKIVILDEIPKGATGKLQRIGLAAEARPRRMKICVFGAGAIGGFLGAQLAAAGAVELRWSRAAPHLAAIRERGLHAASSGESCTVPAARHRRPGRARRRRTMSS